MITYEDFSFDDFDENVLSMESSKVPKDNRIWKCPICNRPFKTKPAMYEHMIKEHPNDIPDGMSPAQYAFNIRNNKTFGLCVQCRTNHTLWNEDAERYDRFCGEACKKAYVIEAKRRMVNKYGKEHLLDDPKYQEKLQEGRSISGKYKFQTDGTEVPYMGSYECDFLMHCDMMHGFKGSEIMRPPFAFEYQYEGKTHLYMPDYFMPNFNLVVECKDGGDNPNMHHKIQEVDKVKERLKDEVMLKQHDYNYIKIVNKEYIQFNNLIKMITSMGFGDPDFKQKINSLCIIP